MAKYFRPFFLLVLVLALLAALEDCRHTVQAMGPAPSPYWGATPGSSPAPGSTLAPAPLPEGNVPAPAPAPKLPHPVAPPLPGGGGSGGSGGGGGGSGNGGSSGLSGGQKAGIVVGVFSAAGLIGFATVVYMKRRSNIRRERFGILARRNQL